MAYGYDSTYSNGGANMLLNAKFGGGGGDAGAGTAGSSLAGQLNAFSNFDPSTMMNALLQDKRNMIQWGVNRKDWEHKRDLNEARNARNLLTQTMPYYHDPLGAAKTQAQSAQLRALYERAPSKMTSFASNATNYPVLDDNALSGAQRQLYLPQTSYFSGRG